MSDPKHPTKVVIVIKKGLINDIFQDKPSNIRFFIADYDTESGQNENLGVDSHGEERYLYETSAWCDTPKVRSIINKKGGKSEAT